jgi:hypothetical protein
MKILTFAAAAAIALGGLTAAPALAQPGHDMHGDSMRHDEGRNNGDMNRGDNGRHNGDMNRGDNGRHNGWNNRHRRQVCQWVRRHHHRERVCSWRRW